VAILGRDSHDPKALLARRQRIGTDHPRLTQYWNWLWNVVVHQKFPKSFTNGLGMKRFLWDRMKNSLFLMLAVSIISIPLSILVGALAAKRRDGLFDSATSGVNLFLAGMPEYVIGTLLLFLFATNQFHLFPSIARVRPGHQPWENLKSLILPAGTLVLAVVPYVSRTMRASTVEVLESDYVEMARLKGLSERTVLWRHAVPNAIGPALQVIAINIAYLVAGVITVEALFNYPGVGLAMSAAVRNHDAPQAQFISIFIATIYVIVTLLADIGTILVTPRLRTTIS
jgi:peptide/nickel transport system permease protein